MVLVPNRSESFSSLPLKFVLGLSLLQAASCSLAVLLLHPFEDALATAQGAISAGGQYTTSNTKVPEMTLVLLTSPLSIAAPVNRCHPDSPGRAV